jgi:hypothetical protein
MIREIPKEGCVIVTRQTPLMQSGLLGLALAIGLGGITAGCSGPTGTGTGSDAEKAPVGIEKLKESMKERAAAKKGHPGGPRGATGGR